MKLKAKGTRNEHKTIAYLEKDGWACTRSAGSLGVWDIIAINSSCVLLIQVKSNNWPAPEERQKLQDFPAPIVAAKEIWRWDDYARSPRIKFLRADNTWPESSPTPKKPS